MKKKIIWIAAIAAAVALAAGGCFWFFRTHIKVCGAYYPQDLAALDLRDREITAREYEDFRSALPGCDFQWTVPFQGERYPEDTKELTVSRFGAADAEMLSYFKSLEKITATSAEDADNLRALALQRQDLIVDYPEEICGKRESSRSQKLTVENADKEALLRDIPNFPCLTRVELTGKIPEDAQSLDEAFPEITFYWTVRLAGRTFSRDTTRLDFSGKKIVPEKLEEAIAALPALEWVNLMDCRMSEEACRAIADRYPEIDFLFPVTVASVTVRTDVKELELSDIRMENTEEVEAALPYLYDLERVIMCNCGISNEEMDALGKRHPEVRFVWTVVVCDSHIRTDATYYIAQEREYITEARTEALRYCVDLIALDVGHAHRLSTCEWVQYMPHLKYLVLGDSGLKDLTPLSQLKELVFLEIFTTKVTDYSPLLGCTALEDLNLGNTYADPTPITQMTWLKNLWWSNLPWRGLSGEEIAQLQDRLTQSLPNTTVVLDGYHPTAKGWRKLQNYFDMRDALHMFYMS